MAEVVFGMDLPGRGSSMNTGSNAAGGGGGGGGSPVSKDLKEFTNVLRELMRQARQQSRGGTTTAGGDDGEDMSPARRHRAEMRNARTFSGASAESLNSLAPKLAGFAAALSVVTLGLGKMNSFLGAVTKADASTGAKLGDVDLRAQQYATSLGLDRNQVKQSLMYGNPDAVDQVLHSAMQNRLNGQMVAPALLSRAVTAVQNGAPVEAGLAMVSGNFGTANALFPAGGAVSKEPEVAMRRQLQSIESSAVENRLDAVGQSELDAQRRTAAYQEAYGTTSPGLKHLIGMDNLMARGAEAVGGSGAPADQGIGASPTATSPQVRPGGFNLQNNRGPVVIQASNVTLNNSSRRPSPAPGE